MTHKITVDFLLEHDTGKLLQKRNDICTNITTLYKKVIIITSRVFDLM